MMNGIVNLTTWSKTYDSTPTQDEISKGKASVEPSSSTPPSNHYLSKDNLVPNSMFWPIKKYIHNSVFNLNDCVDQQYNIVEYLVQAPSAMSTLEFL